MAFAAKWSARSLAAVAAALAVGGCYSPTIKGSFKCNTEYAAGSGDCPENYHCSMGLCVKTGAPLKDGGPDRPDAPSDRPAEVHVDGPAEMAPDVPPEVAPVCLMPLCTSTSTGPGCDPVCQTGCGCHEKCLVNTAGTAVCNVPVAGRARAAGEACDIVSPGSAAQTDVCAPGLVCENDTCGSRCYTFCRNDGDCPGSSCTVSSGAKVCDVPAVACNPVKVAGASSMGCAAAVQGCFLSPTVADRTFCNCIGGNGGVNSSCTVPLDCFPGLACLDVTGTGTSKCVPVCTLPPAANDCSTGTCTSFKGSTKYGYCSI